MIKYVDKSVFNSGCEYIINTVNCVGVMGAGLAQEFALRYPNMFKQYEIDCKNKIIKTGILTLYKGENINIINFPTKYHWKYPSKVEWIASGLDYLVKNYKNWNINSLAIPPLGCGKGNLDFENDVRPLIESKLSNLDIDIYVCLDSRNAEGKEKEMLDNLKNSNIYELCSRLKLSKKVCNSLLDNLASTHRFYEIQSFEGIGKSTYEKLFNYFYNNGKSVTEVVNHTLFD